MFTTLKFEHVDRFEHFIAVLSLMRMILVVKACALHQKRRRVDNSYDNIIIILLICYVHCNHAYRVIYLMVADRQFTLF